MSSHRHEQPSQQHTFECLAEYNASDSMDGGIQAIRLTISVNVVVAIILLVFASKMAVVVNSSAHENQ